MKSFQFVLSILVLFICNKGVIPCEETLQQVHVIFRHGDRSPDKATLYPKDPHLNDTWYPEGLGALTILGKKQEYELGKSLRKRYNNFLGDVYLPEIQEARSTKVYRTKMSLQLVLAGLWPPNKQQTFENSLLWQPVDFDYENITKDDLLVPPTLIDCKNYLKEYKIIESTNKIQNYLQRNKDIIDYISLNSGLQINTTSQLSTLYFCLYTEEHTNRTLPAWTKKIYPEFLEGFATMKYKLQTATNFMVQATGGRVVKKILNDAKNKIKGDLPQNTKIFLYSGHEKNIAYTLSAINSFKPHVPAYASHVIFELHKIDDTYGFMIYHQDKTEDKLELLKIPGCEEFCTIDQFEMLLKDNLPGSNFEC